MHVSVSLRWSLSNIYHLRTEGSPIKPFTTVGPLHLRHCHVSPRVGPLSLSHPTCPPGHPAMSPPTSVPTSSSVHTTRQNPRHHDVSRKKRQNARKSKICLKVAKTTFFFAYWYWFIWEMLAWRFTMKVAIRSSLPPRRSRLQIWPPLFIW